MLVLDERDGRLVETGRVDGLGQGETIQSVRWFGDLAIVVTFRQTDPLYTVDLSDPDRPRVVGALKIPGFSSYLHPVGGDLLVGVGHDATTTGADLGAQAATFDLRDLADVRRVDTLGFGRADRRQRRRGTRARSPTCRSSARWSPRCRTGRRGRSRFVALHVGDRRVADARPARGSRAATPARTSGRCRWADGRIALVGDVVRVVDVR